MVRTGGTCAIGTRTGGRERRQIRFVTAVRSIQPPAKPQGAFLREHIVKKIPLPPKKLAALADTVLQKSATKKLPIGPIKPIDGIGRGIYSIMSDPPDTNGSVGKTHYVQWVNTGLAVFDKTTGNRVLGPIDGNFCGAALAETASASTMATRSCSTTRSPTAGC